MTLNSVTFVVLPSAVAPTVTALASEHAAFDPLHRRVIALDRSWADAQAETTVALTLRSDGTLCATFNQEQALSEAWIEDGFVTASRTP